MNRRQAIKITALTTVAAATIPHTLAQTTDWEYNALEEGTGPFKLPALAYPFDALEPHIDVRTMEVHYKNHHGAYVTNLNKAIGQDIDFYISWASKARTQTAMDVMDRWLERMLKDRAYVPVKIRVAIINNAGGHYNHSLFWQMMKKNGGGNPKGELAMALDRQFGNFSGFKEEFTKAALGLFGCGWTWLTMDAGKLKVETTANEDTPLSSGRPVLLGIDVWEHAYYLKYPNRRADYVAAWFNVVDWDFVAERYAKLRG